MLVRRALSGSVIGVSCQRLPTEIDDGQSGSRDARSQIEVDLTPKVQVENEAESTQGGS